MSAEFFFRNWFIHPLKAIDALVFVSQFSYEQHLKAMPALAAKQTLVAHNAIEQLPEDAISTTMGSYYLYFGRLSHEKGLVTLINAFNALPDLRLKIVGEGPMESSLREIAGKNIEFCGYQSGDILRTTIRDSKAIVVPSEWYENNPMTIIEAYTAGIPVIGAKIGGIPEIIDEGQTGYIFEPGNVEQLIGAILQATQLSDADYTTMSNAARKFAAENFSEERSYDNIINLYNSIINDYER
jgi:glycosyltransferase involved in cell wall biosynthesis